jgi:hypothetical protein
MKTVLLPIFSFLFIFSANAQSVIDSWGGEFPVSPLEEYGKAYRPGLPVPADYTGSFYFEEDFIPGVIVVEGKEEQLNVFLRYNALKDQVEYKLNKKENEVRLLPTIKSISYKTPAYDYIWKTFKVEDGKEISGYVISYFNGEEAKFLAKPIAVLQPEVLPRTGYDRYKPANMSVKPVYLLSIGDGAFKEVKLEEKQIRNALPASSFLNDYFTNHKIETVEDVVKLLRSFEEQPSNI